ncbi:MAG: DUF5681 domain-containing protein, partial [Caulobacterales bacterium]
MSSDSPRDPATGKFAAGQSGNPSGRPRRRGAVVNRTILEALKAPVTVEDEAGAPLRLTKLAAAARQVADKGVAGDARDGKLALELALKAEDRTPAPTRRGVGGGEGLDAAAG